MSVLVLKCRQCGSDVVSNEKARKCRNCSELFPFECAVCSKHLRPPLPDYPVERFFNDEGLPLCEEHYQRQCPECERWFRADENPGFFLCAECTTERDAREASSSPRSGSGSRGSSASREDGDGAPAAAKSGCGASVVALFALGSSLVWWLARNISA
jgi:hypothetical protein